MAKFTREEVIAKIQNNDLMFWGDDLRGLDLRGIDFKNTDLIGANLSGVNLSGGSLFFAHTMGIKLRNANLQGADLRWLSLTDADLRNANLSGSNMEKCSFEGADLRGANLRGANVEDVTVDANTKLPDDANFLTAMSTKPEGMLVSGPASKGGVRRGGWGPNDMGGSGGGCGSIIAGSLTLSLIAVSLLLVFH